ncbi:MAG: energy-coupling factor transporter ATPase [Syntrophobacterales bacterium]|nr:energy-coupling factor transporter ATPase [Syntrophobacterales bacterium]
MHDISQPIPYLEPSKPTIIELRDIDYDYPGGRKALRRISLFIYEGDRLAVVGKNGAGKTTLAKLIAGIYKPTQGEIAIMKSQRIGMVLQDWDDQLFCPTVFEDIAFGLLLAGFSRREAEERVLEWARKLEIDEYLEREPHRLSYGERKRVVLAAVLALEPDILILDEPTVGLDRKSEGIIFDILRGFRGTIICISHDLFFLYFLCQRALVLKNGSVHHDYTMRDLVSQRGTLREHGLDFTFRFECCGGSSPVITRTKGRSFVDQGTSYLELYNYSYRYPGEITAIRNISLKIERGERVAVVGENGAGKSTLALCLVGLLKGEGTYLLEGREVCDRTRKTLWRRIGIVFQDARDQLFTSSCFEEVAFGVKRMGLSERETRERVKWALEALRLRAYEDKVPYHLSGGEKKRLALATILAMKPDVIILDEPTNDLDPEGEKILMEVLDEVESTLIVISHDVCFLSFLCDRALILENGCLKADVAYEEFLKAEHLSLGHHHEQDYRLRCCHAIRELFYSS